MYVLSQNSLHPALLASQPCLSSYAFSFFFYQACFQRLAPTNSYFVINIYFNETSPGTSTQVCTCCRQCAGIRYVPSGQVFATCSSNDGRVTLSATSSHKRGVQRGKQLKYAVAVDNHVADTFEGLGMQIVLPPGVTYKASKVLPRIKDSPRWGANKGVGQSRLCKPFVNATGGDDGTTVLRWPYVPIPGNSRRKFVVGMKVDKDGPPVTSLVFQSNLYQSGNVAFPFCENYANNVTVAIKKISGPI